jgi:hypothetical protein
MQLAGGTSSREIGGADANRGRRQNATLLTSINTRTEYRRESIFE